MADGLTGTPMSNDEVEEYLKTLEAQGSTTPSSGPMSNEEAERYIRQLSGETVDEDDEEGGLATGLKDVGRGLVAAPISFTQGLAELPAMASDFIFDTKITPEVVEAGEATKEFLGVDDLGLAGQMTDEVATFLMGFIPLAGWAGKVSAQTKRLSQAGALPLQTGAISGLSGRLAERAAGSVVGQYMLTTKPGLIGTTALGTGLLEMALSPEGRPSFADGFEFLPDFMESEEYNPSLGGRENATRIMRNRLRRGTEGALLSGAFDTALSGAAATARAFPNLPVVGPASVMAARGTTRAMRESLRKVSEATGMAAANDLFRRWFMPSKGAPRWVMMELEESLGRSDHAKSSILRRFEQFVKVARTSGQGRADMPVVFDNLFKYSTGDIHAMDDYVIPKAGKPGEFTNPIKEVADKMLKEVQQVRKPLLDSLEAELKALKDARRTPQEIKGMESLIKTIRQSEGAEIGYLSRIFRMYEPGEKIRFYDELKLHGGIFEGAVDQIVEFMENAIKSGKSEVSGDYLRGWSDMLADAAKKGMTQEQRDRFARAEAKKILYDLLGLHVADGVSPEMALKAMRESLKKPTQGEGIRGMVATKRPLLQIAEDIFQPRQEIIERNPLVRKMMGEVTDPEVLYVHTVDQMAKLSAAADYYKHLDSFSIPIEPAIKQINEGGRPLVVEGPDPEMIAQMGGDKISVPGTPEQADILREVGAPLTWRKEAVGPASYTPGHTLVQQAQAQIAALRQAGYEQLTESTGRGRFGGEFGAITGKWVPREMKDLMMAPRELGLSPLGDLFSALSQARGLSQKALIIPNPATRAREIIGGTGMVTAAGNFRRDMDWAGVIQVFSNRVKSMDKAQSRNFLRQLELSGVSNSNLVLSALKRFLGEKRGGPISKGVGKVVDFFEGEPIEWAGGQKLPLYPNIMRGFAKFTEGTDNVFKGITLMAEEAKYQEAFAKAGLAMGPGAKITDDAIAQLLVDQGLMTRIASNALKNEGLTPLQLMAAELTKDIMPTYSRVGLFVKELDRIPLFGNFVSFASENIRNSANIVWRGLKEMSFEITDPAMRKAMGEEAATMLERNIRSIGSQRIASFTSVALLMPAAVTRAGMWATGTTQDQMTAIYDSSRDYLAGHQLVPIENDGEGRVKVIDLSYASPYGFVTDAATAALREYGKQGRLGKGEVEKLGRGVWQIFSGYVDPFASEAIIFERIRDVLPSEDLGSLGVGRGGKTATGAHVYEENDPLGDKLSAGFLHIVDSLVPAYIKLGAEVRGGEVRPGRMSRAFWDVPGPRGQEHDTFEEIARQFTGFTPMELNLHRDFEFNGKVYQEARNQAKGAANRIIIASDRSPQEMVQHWSDALDSLYRAQSQLHAETVAARTLGVSRERLYRQLTKEAKLSKAEADHILNGEFYPRPLSVETIKKVERQKHEEERNRLTDDLPVTAINDMVRARMGQPLRAVPEEAPSVAPVPMQSLQSGPMPDDEVSSFLQSLQQLEAPAPMQPPAPAPAPAPQGRRTPENTPAGLLGSDPWSAFLNSTIFRNQ